MKVLPSELAREFNPETDLPGHYILATDEAVLPRSWVRYEQGKWRLACEKRLPAFRLEDANATPIGFLIGYPITAEGELHVDQTQPIRVADLDHFEEWLYTLSGRWVAVLLAGERQRVYMDPAGSLVCVYSPATGIVAASPALVPYTDDTPDRVELIQQMPIPESVTMYYVGMTPRYGIDRLLPNHYLDLTTWQIHRHWPAGPIERISDTDAACAEIAGYVKRSIAAVAAHYPLQLSLTSGRDSRLMIACARPHIDDTHIFTSDMPDGLSLADVIHARKMAPQYGLHHRVIPYTPPSEREKRLWLYRSGFAIGNYPSMVSMRSIQELDTDRAYLSGYIGEVARYFYNSKLADPLQIDQKITPEFLISLIAAPVVREGVDSMAWWLEDQPLIATDQILDLFYVEERIGAWIAVGASVLSDFLALELWPLNNRRVIEIMLGLPVQFKLDYGLHEMIIAAEWPELLEEPFNPPIASDQRRKKIKRFLKRLGL